MKVHFTSKKERQPTVDEGLRVIYAPSKRVAYRLRWYLILLVVASPLLWFAGKLLTGVMVLDAPARIFQPLTEIRAMESGVVTDVHVQPNQPVEAGSLLISLDNRGLSAQWQALRDGLQASTLTTAPALQQQRLLQGQIERAQRRVSELQQLVKVGAATRGELDQARDLLDGRKIALAGLQHSLQPDATLQQELKRNQNELVVVEKRLQYLQAHSSSDGLVRDVLVHEGESVGPGTLMLQLQADRELEIQVFLAPDQRELARAGQSLRLRMPDSSWLDAVVLDSPSLVARLPPDMRSPFGAEETGLVLRVATVEPLPAAWKLDNLQLTARFPNLIQRWLQR